MLIIGNWKMNGNRADARRLVEDTTAWLRERSGADVECVFCPPATLLREVAEWVGDQAGVTVGGQDCHAQESGAHTGDISAGMLKEAGCNYVILGHSERRQYYHESDALVAAKAETALKHGLIPVICIGETLEEYERNHTLPVVERQVVASVPDGHKENVVIAYEPVWSIGTGKVPGMDEIEVVHSAIITYLVQKKGIAYQQISVLYGGSVKPENAAPILKISDVGGVLVGGASLKAGDFCAIMKTAGTHA